MLEIKKILHPTDFSTHADVALDHALHLARQHEAELHLLHVMPTLGEDPLTGAFQASTEEDAFAEKLRAKAEAQMQALVESHRHTSVRLRRVLSQGVAAAPVILDYAQAEGVDLIVMGTHGHRGVKHFLLGSVAEEVVHQAPSHVLTVRRQKGAGDEARPIQRILVPIDFSAYALPLLKTAKELADGYGAQLHLLHVIKPLSFPVSITTALTIHDLIPGITEKTQARLDGFLQEAAGPAVPAEIHVREGHPSVVIIERAEALHADLIMLAPRGMTGLERYCLGSVAERVVRRASCPVFIAKAEVAEAAGPGEAAASAQVV